MNEALYASIEAVLRKLNMERTRENYLWVLYDGNVPVEDWDEAAEQQLPPDLRLT